MGQTLDCCYKGIKFTQSHRPEETIPDPYDKCEPGLRCLLNGSRVTRLSEFKSA